jgi:malonate-semialdehyde dehydrogenase (acetylating)/methylmalonate-semialdehyde dehydrogenase
MSEPERRGELHNPATGEVTGSVHFASVTEVDDAVARASSAWADWRESSLAERSTALFAFRELADRHRDELASSITAEHGKTHADALGEVARGIEIAELACGIPQLLKGEMSENVSRRVDTFSIRQPLGVVAGITPFNFPAMVPMWMFPLAVACGNSFILKPSEKDPSTSARLAELFVKAGLPDGVLTVLNGDRVAVDRILEHPDIRAISFVGSTPVARHVYETGTRHGKRVQALGGAKNHMIVLPDADLDLAADAAVSAGFGSAGERCMAISVLVAVGPIADGLVERIVARVGALKIGAGDIPGVDMGPLITAEHRDRVAGYVTAGAEAGAAVVVDGREHPCASGPGYFLGPTVLDQVHPEMSVYTDEIFGPVLCVVRADSYEEAVGLVNANPYGNGTALFTNDGGAARRFQHEVEAGMVGINVPIPVPVATFPFGGWKASLFGDTHVYGTDGMRFYTRNKVVTSRWPDPSHRGVELGFPTSR